MARDLKIRAIVDGFETLKALAVLVEAKGEEVAAATGLSREKTYRVLNTWVSLGVVEKVPNGFGLGDGMGKLWAAYRDRLHRIIDRCEKELLETEVRGE